MAATLRSEVRLGTKGQEESLAVGWAEFVSGGAGIRASSLVSR